MGMKICAAKTRIHFSKKILPIPKPKIHIDWTIKLKNFANFFNKIEQSIIFERDCFICSTNASFNLVLAENRDRLVRNRINIHIGITISTVHKLLYNILILSFINIFFEFCKVMNLVNTDTPTSCSWLNKDGELNFAILIAPHEMIKRVI